MTTEQLDALYHCDKPISINEILLILNGMGYTLESINNLSDSEYQQFADELCSELYNRYIRKFDA